MPRFRDVSYRCATGDDRQGDKLDEPIMSYYEFLLNRKSGVSQKWCSSSKKSESAKLGSSAKRPSDTINRLCVSRGNGRVSVGPFLASGDITGRQDAGLREIRKGFWRRPSVPRGSTDCLRDTNYASTKAAHRNWVKSRRESEIASGSPRRVLSSCTSSNSAAIEGPKPVGAPHRSNESPKLRRSKPSLNRGKLDKARDPSPFSSRSESASQFCFSPKQHQTREAQFGDDGFSQPAPEFERQSDSGNADEFSDLWTSPYNSPRSSGRSIKNLPSEAFGIPTRSRLGQFEANGFAEHNLDDNLSSSSSRSNEDEFHVVTGGKAQKAEKNVVMHRAYDHLPQTLGTHLEFAKTHRLLLASHMYVVLNALMDSHYLTAVETSKLQDQIKNNEQLLIWAYTNFLRKQDLHAFVGDLRRLFP